MINNIRNNTISEIDAKKYLNTLNEMQKLKNEKVESRNDENEYEDKNEVENENEDDDYDYEDDDETMNQNKKNPKK